MRMPNKLCTTIAWSCLALACLSPPAQASDPYLDMLEEEAQVLELLKTAEQMDAKSQAQAGGITGQNTTRAVLGAGMAQDQFDDALKTHFVGTYMLYEKLSAQEKSAVYVRYQHDGQIMEIRRAIAEHL